MPKLTRKQLIELLRPVCERGAGLLKQSLSSLLQLATENGISVDGQIDAERPTKRRAESAEADAPKRRRTDVAARKAAAKNLAKICVKMSLKKFCFPTGAALPIQDAVTAANQLCREAYMLANFHILRLLEERTSLPQLTQNFFQRCLSAATSNRAAVNDPLLATSAVMFRQARSSDCDPAAGSGLRGFDQNLAQQMATAAKNHVSTNLYNRLKHHLLTRLDCSRQHAYHLLKDIFAIDCPPTAQPLVRYFRRLMPLPPTEKNMQAAPHQFMRILYEIQRFNDRNCSLKGVRSFSLLPHTDGFTSKYVTVCSTGLHTLLKSSGAAVPGESAFLADKERLDQYWKQLFKVEKLLEPDRRRKFAYMFLTDGKAVSVVMTRPIASSPVAPHVLREGDFDEVLGVDPGMRDMYVASSADGRLLRCSSAEFYNDAGYVYSRKKLECWKAANPVIGVLERNIPTNKTADLTTLKKHISYVTRHQTTLSQFYGAQRVKNLKFKRFCACKKKLHQLCTRLAAHGKRTLVGFGDWSIVTAAGVVKGCRPGPSTRLRRELKRYATVVDIDEYRTSKTCNTCKLHSFENMLHRVHDDATDRMKSHKVHCVLHCKTSGCLSKTVNRDVNASRNIMELTIHLLCGQPRPPCFSRH